MSAVESRLAATLAKHRMDANVGFCTAGCQCGWRAPLAMGSHPRVEHERHLAQVIASSDDLAVVPLAKPDEDHEYGKVWRDDDVLGTVMVSPDGSIMSHSEFDYEITPAEMRAAAGIAAAAAKAAVALLAAAKAAEGVARDGE